MFGRIKGPLLLSLATCSIAATGYSYYRYTYMPSSFYVTVDLRSILPRPEPSIPSMLISNSARMNVLQAMQALDTAKSDPRVKGVIILSYGEQTRLQLADMCELSDAIQEVTKSKETHFFELQGLKVPTLYLASVCAQVYSLPHIVHMLTLPTMTSVHVKGLFDKVGVQAQTVSCGTHKGAGDQFTSATITKTGRESMENITSSLKSTLMKQILANRSISEQELIDCLRTPILRTDTALQKRIIDRVGYPEEIQKELQPETLFVPLSFYNRQTASRRSVSKGQRLALIDLHGTINLDQSLLQTLQLLKAAAKDKSVCAVVLRVDSPGGDVISSDLIRHQIELCSKDKPVICTMGSTAASGGYMASLACDRIFALPVSITGSIGVVVAKFSIADLLNKVGISVEYVGDVKSASFQGISQPWADHDMDLIRTEAQSVYGTFTHLCKQRRNLNDKEIENVAEGKVWTGDEAVQKGLVDELGGYEAAASYALGKASIQTTQSALNHLFPYRPPKSFLDIDDIDDTLSLRPLPSILPPFLSGLPKALSSSITSFFWPLE